MDLEQPLNNVKKSSFNIVKNQFLMVLIGKIYFKKMDNQ